jgi:hypothetical protein
MPQVASTAVLDEVQDKLSQISSIPDSPNLAMSHGIPKFTSGICEVDRG